jgi:DnaJ-class molecular chaperone
MDYYHILGVKPNATDTEIKKAYRELSFKYHPDKHVNSSDFQKKENDKKIKELNEAYETLKDPQLRSQYDIRDSNPFEKIFGEMFKHHSMNNFRNPYQQQPTMNIFDILNELQSEPIIFTYDMNGGGMGHNGMGHNGMGHNGMAHNGMGHATIEPVEIKLEITLEQAFTGSQIPIMITREIRKGISSYKEQERIYMNIPQGVDTDEIITIHEKGNEVNGTKGDVKVQIVIKHHEVFERKGLNLIHKYTIDFKQSIIGFDFVLNYIDGTSFRIKSSRGNIIQNLDEKIIKGKGFSRDGSTGDLIILFKVLSPKTLTEEQLLSIESIL